MADSLEVKELDQVVVRFSGDSGDGMQLAGNIFSTVSATVGNSISTFPDYPADIRAPQGSLTGVSGFQVHVGAAQVYTPGDQCDVLVAMNAAALKTQYKYAKPGAAIIIDTDSFGPKDLEKNQCVLVRRDTREKVFVSLDELETAIPAQLEALRKDLYERALANREKRTWAATTMDEVKELAKANTGYIKTMWCGDLACEMKMKEEVGLSSRCMPFAQEHLSDVGPCCGKPASKMVYWGVAY